MITVLAQRAEIKHDLAEQAASTLTETVDRRAGGLSRLAIGIAIGLGMEGGVHSAVRFARAGGCSTEDIEHVVRLAITTIGWPKAMAAMSWVQDQTDDEA